PRVSTLSHTTLFRSKMVGRDAELATLLEAFDQARDGHPATVVVRGEAGIGKTRLLHEFLEQADRRTRPGDLPVIVAQGQCVDLRSEEHTSELQSREN